MKKKLLWGLVSIFLFTNVVKAEEVSEKFSKVAPNGVVNINAVKPTNEDELFYFTSVYSSKVLPNSEDYIYFDKCNEDFSTCELIYHDVYEDDNGITQHNQETHEVKMVWKEKDAQIAKIAEEYIKKISEVKSFVLTDLNYINYLNHLKTEEIYVSTSINYIPKLKETVNYDSHISFDFVLQMGEALLIFPWAQGGFVLSYDGVMYDVVSKGSQNAEVVYIDDETKDSSEEYINAAKKRITEYLGHDDIEISVAGTIEEIKEETDLSSVENAKMGDNYYKLKINEITTNILIIKDSSKIEKPVTNTKDTVTNVSVETTSSEVPLDTTVTVNEVTKETAEHKSIVEVIKTDVFQAFDISLFSATLNDNIKKLENGVFKVTVPIKEELKDKKLYAYYIKEDNTLEEHDVTIDEDGNAVFETNHFSTYIISEKINTKASGEAVPPTGDNIITYIVIGLFGAIGLISCSIITNKKI